MDFYLKVRLARRGSMCERAAAGHFGISGAIVKKMMRFSIPPGYQRSAEIKRPKLDGFTDFIDQWLQDDLRRNRKQRHTAKRILSVCGMSTNSKGAIRQSRAMSSNMGAAVRRCLCRWRIPPATPKRILARQWL